MKTSPPMAPQDRVAALRGAARQRFFHTLGVEIEPASHEHPAPDVHAMDRAIRRVQDAMQHAVAITQLIGTPMDDPESPGWRWGDDVPAAIAMAHVRHLEANLAELHRSCMSARAATDGAPPPVAAPGPHVLHSEDNDIVIFKGSVPSKSGRVIHGYGSARIVSLWPEHESPIVACQSNELVVVYRNRPVSGSKDRIRVNRTSCDQSHQDGWPAEEVRVCLHRLVDLVMQLNSALYAIEIEIDGKNGMSFLNDNSREAYLSFARELREAAHDLIPDGLDSHCWDEVGRLIDAKDARAAAKGGSQ